MSGWGLKAGLAADWFAAVAAEDEITDYAQMWGHGRVEVYVALEEAADALEKELDLQHDADNFPAGVVAYEILDVLPSINMSNPVNYYWLIESNAIDYVIGLYKTWGMDIIPVEDIIEAKRLKLVDKVCDVSSGPGAVLVGGPLKVTGTMLEFADRETVDKYPLDNSDTIHTFIEVELNGDWSDVGYQFIPQPNRRFIFKTYTKRVDDLWCAFCGIPTKEDT